MAWKGCDTENCSSIGDGDYEILLYDGTSTTQLTNNDYKDEHPQINDNGYVVWQGCDGLDCEVFGGDWEIFLYDGSSTTQLTNNDYYDCFPQINNNGYVVWSGRRGSDSEIFLAISCSSTNDYDDDLYVSASCGGNDCDDGDPDVNPGISESDAAGNCDDGFDNDCDGYFDCNDLDCPACPTSCAASAAASTLEVDRVYGASDLGKHLAFFLLPLGALIGLTIWRRKR